MFDIALRRQKDNVIDPIACRVPAWITPLRVTYAAFVCGLASCFAACNAAFGLALGLWLLNRFLDCLDGAVARSRSETSELGGFLDLLMDFIVYSAIPISIAIGEGKNFPSRNMDWAVLAGLEASFHVNNFVLFYTAAVVAERHGKELTSVTMHPALIEGFESGVFFTAMLIWPHRLVLLSTAMMVGVLAGTVQRSTHLAAVLGRIDSRKRRVRYAE